MCKIVGVLSVTVIVVDNVNGDPSSNAGESCVSFTLC